MPAGRPRKELNPKIIQRMAAIGCTMNEIAQVFEVSVDTLERNYADIIKTGRADGAKCLRRKQWQIAMNNEHKGQTTMCIWLGKQLLGQADKLETKDEEKPIESGTNFLRSSQDSARSMQPN